MTAIVSLITAVLLVATAAPLGADVAQGQKAKGEPVKVFTIGTTGTAEVQSAAIEQVAKAYEGFINDRGGVGKDGRPLDVTFCNDQNNPNAAEQCARQAQSEGAVAVVGGFSIVGGDAILDVLTPAGIPWIGPGLFGFGVQTSPASYPTMGGSPTEWVEIGRQAGKRGCKTAGEMRWDQPSGLVSMDFFRHGIESAGGQIGPVASVATDATDLAPAVATATEGVNCVAIGMSPQQGPLAVQAIQQAGVDDVRLAFYPDAVPPSAVKQTGGKKSPAEGGLSASWFPAPNDKKWKQAKDAVKKYAEDPGAVEFTDTFRFQITWVAYKAFTEAVKGLETIDAPSVRAAFDQATALKTGGLTPPLQFQTPAIPGNPAYSRIFNPFVTLLTIKDAKYTALGKKGFIDTSDLLATYRQTPGLLGGAGGGGR